MKNFPKYPSKTLSWCILIAFVLFFAWATFVRQADAASVLVYPVIHNSHDGVRNAADLSVCIDQGTFHQCDKGVPTFQLPTADLYQVSGVAPAGYSYQLGDGCAQAASADNLQCNIDWFDGAPIIEAPAVNVPPPAPAIAVAPISAGSVPSLVLPADVTAATSSETGLSLSEQQQIALLQAQIIELYKILIALLTQKLAVLQ